MCKEIFRRHVDLNPSCDVIDPAPLGKIVRQGPATKFGEVVDRRDFNLRFQQNGSHDGETIGLQRDSGHVFILSQMIWQANSAGVAAGRIL